MEMTTILRERIAAKLTLRELSDALGQTDQREGFSPAQLSLAERGLRKLKPHDEALVIAIIRRVATISRARRSAIAAAKKIDLREFTVDLREGRASACAE